MGKAGNRGQDFGHLVVKLAGCVDGNQFQGIHSNCDATSDEKEEGSLILAVNFIVILWNTLKSHFGDYIILYQNICEKFTNASKHYEPQPQSNTIIHLKEQAGYK